MSQNWHERTLTKLDKACSKHDNKTLAKFRIKPLKKVIARVSQFSNNSCEKCKEHRSGIEDSIRIIDNYSNGDRKSVRAYNMVMRTIVAHLKKAHGLVEEGTYLATYIPLGLGFGLIVNTLFSNTIGLTLGMSIGVGLGVAIGSLLDYKAKKDGKII